MCLFHLRLSWIIRPRTLWDLNDLNKRPILSPSVRSAFDIVVIWGRFGASTFLEEKGLTKKRVVSFNGFFVY